MRTNRRGNHTITFVVGATALLGALALGVDHTYQESQRVALQNALDAAAYAGTAQLNGTTTGYNNARTAVQAVLGANYVDNTSVDINDVEVARGWYERDSLGNATFTLSTSDLLFDDSDVFNLTVVGGTDAVADTKSQAVLIQYTKSDVSSLFGSIFGVGDVTVNAVALSVGGSAGTAECPMPLSVPSCEISTLSCGDTKEFVMNGNGDDIAWAVPTSMSPTQGNSVEAAFTGSCVDTAVSDQVDLNNGVIQSGFDYLVDVIEGVPGTLDPNGEMEIKQLDPTDFNSRAAYRTGESSLTSTTYNNYTALVGRVALFDGDDDCVAGEYSGSLSHNEDIDGYAWLGVYDVGIVTGKRYVSLVVLCGPDYEDEGLGGGTFNGNEPVEPSGVF